MVDQFTGRPPEDRLEEFFNNLLAVDLGAGAHIPDVSWWVGLNAFWLV